MQKTKMFSAFFSYNKKKGKISVNFLELRQKDVINCNTGERIGFVLDLEFDPKTGQIHFLIVPKARKIVNCLGKNQVYRIPYRCIVRIGRDTILVDINEKECLK
ncbi:YlmC/YmxH family sporulation protein [Anaerostipes sp. MSJ-23]|uniref:YlmC/YmxH family sporulation protein n=1 Tax=unclassified Anaerostipes TaxID=2635253 RepID=UPI00209E4DD1|nr:YlmC/YmxH family sporulation protein [Anaerostipes sp. MSJ-23]